MSARAHVLVSMLALGVLLAGSQPAAAAGSPPPQTPRPAESRVQWSGCHVGPGIGTVPGRMAVDWTPDAGGFPDQVQRARLRDNGSGRMDGPGFVLGGQAGCTRRMDRFVWGAEADVMRTNLDEARETSVPAPGGGLETYSRVFGSDWTATVRARAGWLIRPTMLLYGTGGLATADADTEDSVALPDGSINAVADARTRTGWTAGGGVEWTLRRPWSMRVGYLYADFGSFVTTSQNSATGRSSATITHTHRLQEHLVVTWLTFHF
jgi:outer membrane immunogenic protein